ncbi:MAG: hypothetical protein B6I24_06645 [Bacteroidetes bacterium 4572_128]|nr:MAG: hypothetical protein B6I24_06645 [Bacteroidetes bacterium 4572_128]
MNLVKKLIKIEAFILTLEFLNKEILKINLKEQIKEWAEEPSNIFNELLNEEYFKTVQYDEDWETIYWDNGIDLCADLLYKIAQKQKITNL